MKKLMMMLCALAVMAACSHDDSNNGDNRPAAMTDGRVVLVYMAAENSLSPQVAVSLEQMKAASSLIGSGNTLLVYVDRSEPRELPWMARIADGRVTDSVSLKDMNISQKNELASDPQVMERVISYAVSHYPAKRDYGLVLWGHSSGWLVDPDSVVVTRAFGVDNGQNSHSNIGKWINMPTLARVLCKNPAHWKFIFADCCNFMCLESLYELRSVTDYIIGSPAEIPSVGAPYKTVVPAMFNAADDFYRGIADCYYAQQVYGRSLPMSVVNTSQLSAVAQATRTVLSDIRSRLGGGYADMTGLIHYYNTGATFNTDYNIFYDAGDFVRKYAQGTASQSWFQALDRAVVYKLFVPSWNTGKQWAAFYNDFTATEDRYHGVSMFVAQSPEKGSYARYNSTIRNLQWYKAAGLNTIGW